MSDARRVMAGWLGLAVGSGKIGAIDAAAGDALAEYVIGRERLDELRAFMGADPEVAVRERRAAIELCIWMAHADRAIDPEERHLLRQIIGGSDLPDDVQDELIAAVHQPPPIDGIEARLTHPALRELMLALAWELALADERIEREESALFTDLAQRLGVSAMRAREIRDAIGERV